MIREPRTLDTRFPCREMEISSLEVSPMVLEGLLHTLGIKVGIRGSSWGKPSLGPRIMRILGVPSRSIRILLDSPLEQIHTQESMVLFQEESTGTAHGWGGTE